MDDIKIPEQYMVHFQKVNDSSILFGTMHLEKSKAVISSNNLIESKLIDNHAMIGFKIVKNITKLGQGYNSHNYVIWRIQDPRGFETEINHSSLMELIKYCNIEKGEILEKCIWARGKKENILLPLESDIYKEALSNTEKSKIKISIKDVKPGYKIRMSKISGVYLGAMYPIYGPEKGIQFHLDNVKSDKKYHLIKENDYIHVLSTLKINDIIDSNNLLSLADVEKELNEKLEFNLIKCDKSSIIGFSLEKIKNIDLKYEFIKMNFLNVNSGRFIENTKEKYNFYKKLFFKVTDNDKVIWSLMKNNNNFNIINLESLTVPNSILFKNLNMNEGIIRTPNGSPNSKCIININDINSYECFGVRYILNLNDKKRIIFRI